MGEFNILHQLKLLVKFRYFLGFIIFVLACLYSEITVASSPTSPHVLYLNSYHRGYSWSDTLEDGLRETLKNANPAIDVSVEYLDAKNYPALNHAPALAEALAAKYHSVIYDAVIVSDNAAFNFIAKYREQITPHAPIIFCGYNSFRPNILNGIKNITGVNEEIDFTGTIDMALTLHPQTKQLVFITADFYTSGKANHEVVENLLIPQYQNHYAITQLKNLYLQDIKHKLMTLPKHALVFVFGQSLDLRDQSFLTVEEYYRQIAAASPVPSYGFWDFILNTGMMGGNIITGTEQGRLAAELTLKVLNNTPADSIPVVMETPTSKIFDFHAMQRFGITEAVLPKGSVIINKPDSFYQKNKLYIWLGFYVIMILLISISILLVLLRRSYQLRKRLGAEIVERQNIEATLRKYQENLEDTVHQRTLEIQQINEALREREALFHGMFDSHSAVMLLTNPETGYIIEANQAALNYYGYNLIELRTLAIDCIYQLSRTDIENEMARAKVAQRKYFEFRHRLANGEIRDVEVHAAPVVWQRQTLLFNIIHDVTERKQIHQALQTRELQLKELNTTKDRLFSIIAHDLRSPFQAILGLAEYLRECLQLNSAEKNLELVNDIYVTSDNTFKLLNTLLDWARTQTDQVSLNIEKTNVASVVSEVLPSLYSVVYNKEIALQVRVVNDIFVYADRNMLNTVLRNLVSNAIKYTHKNGTIEIRMIPHTDTVEIQVSDTGVGMTEEVKSQLFASSVNHSTYGTNHEKGTGLGLVICRDFILKQGGTIKVDSELGKGSVFRFLLPRAERPRLET